MKILLKSLLLILVFQNASLCIAQSTESDKKTHIVDSIGFPRQQKFQEFVDMLSKSKNINLDDEPRVDYNLLDTDEKAKTFAKTLAVNKFPKSKKYIDKYINVSQDNSGKLWFISIDLAEPGKAFDSKLSMIFFKSDCKVIHFSNHF